MKSLFASFALPLHLLPSWGKGGGGYTVLRVWYNDGCVFENKVGRYAHATLGSLSLLMKGKTLPTNSVWAGCPAQVTSTIESKYSWVSPAALNPTRDF